MEMCWNLEIYGYLNLKRNDMKTFEAVILCIKAGIEYTQCLFNTNQIVASMVLQSFYSLALRQDLLIRGVLKEGRASADIPSVFSTLNQ